MSYKAIDMLPEDIPVLKSLDKCLQTIWKSFATMQELDLYYEEHVEGVNIELSNIWEVLNHEGILIEMAEKIWELAFSRWKGFFGKRIFRKSLMLLSSRGADGHRYKHTEQ